jgi:hypothetical protein
MVYSGNMTSLCPHCYAEIDEDTQDCFNCGGQEKVVEQAFVGLELAGTPLQKWEYASIPVGTLIDNRFTIIKENEQLLDGYCYLVMDQALVRRCFLILWEFEHHIWTYHKRICLRSPVVHCGLQPFYSVFPPQQGVALPKAIQDFGWSPTKRWEVFRQVCSLLSTFHHDGIAFEFLHPKSLWVTSDGLIEFSLQKEQLPSTWLIGDWKEEIRSLIRILFWLFSGQEEGEHWAVLPLKIIPVVRKAWEQPIPSGELWLRMDDAIRNRGLYSLPLEAKEWLLQVHHPNIIQLGDKIVAVPNSIQLCVWNSVRVSWRLYRGRVLLYSDLISLYESGFVEHQEGIPMFSTLRNFILHQKMPLESDDPILSAYIFAEYQMPEKARLQLAKVMRSSRSSSDWITVARILFSLYDQKEGWHCLSLAKKWTRNVPDKLEIAAFIRWELGAISEAKRYILSWAKELDSQEFLWVAEAWMNLFSASKRTQYFIEQAIVTSKDASFEDQYQIIERSVERFGQVDFLLKWFAKSIGVIQNETELLKAQQMATQFEFSDEWIQGLSIIKSINDHSGEFEEPSSESEFPASEEVVSLAKDNDYQPPLRVEGPQKQHLEQELFDSIDNRGISRETQKQFKFRYVLFVLVIFGVFGIIQWF